MNIGRRSLVLLMVMCSSLLAASQAGAKVRCHDIHTVGVGQIHFASNSSDGRFLGRGLLHGKVHGEFTFTGPDSYEGTFTITTHHGVLVLHTFDGFFDSITGEFRNDSSVIAGTGRFEEARGRLFFQGFVALPSDRFIEHITGKICLEARPDEDDDRDHAADVTP